MRLASDASQRVRYRRGIFTAMLFALSVASGVSLAAQTPLNVAVYRGATLPFIAVRQAVRAVLKWW